ncbi:MAG: c-type cytochrome [Comamonadaceae bacterium]
MNKLSASWLQVCGALALTLGLSGVAGAQSASPDSAAEIELGRRIYNEGVLAPGVELTGARVGNPPTSGAAAACVNCHRRSGMGQVDSDILIQPITGNFLFASKADKRVTTMDPHVGKRFNQTHEPYTFAALGNAIRNGVNNRGKTMDAAMPRFNLNDAQLKAVIAYLKQLSVHWSPGVSQTSIRFATVITPEVDPAHRKVLIDMMRAVFRQKNGSTAVAKPGQTRHHMTSAAELILGTERKWELDIWELQGAPQTWNEQLAARYRRQPVFALLSGASGSTWQPVHDFCDREQVPCWFPSVPVPGKSMSPYALYFSGGVTLEAQVLARHWLDQKEPPKQVVQIYRDGEPGRAAAQSLTQALAGSGVAVVDRVLAADVSAAEGLRQALETVKPADTVIYWLRTDDVAALRQLGPVAQHNYFSALLAQAEQAPVPVAWRASSSLVYLYELPDARKHNLDYFNAWLKISKLPLVDEGMQSEVFFALNFMTDTVSEMLDNLYRDYLVERAESLLSTREGVKAAQETRDRVALGRAGDLLKKHGPSKLDESVRVPISSQAGSPRKSEGTTLYPHLSLAPNQRLASLGGYIVRFANDTGNQLQAQSELIVP